MRFDDRIPLYVNIPVEEANKILCICHDKDISISDYVTNVLKEHGRKERFFHRQIIDKALKDGSMTGYPPFPMTPVEFDEFYSEYLKLKEEKDANSDRESIK